MTHAELLDKYITESMTAIGEWSSDMAADWKILRAEVEQHASEHGLGLEGQGYADLRRRLYDHEEV